ncbi:MAG: hypothetical protein ACYDH6_19255 [Acidimicrobiales bacterium]
MKARKTFNKAALLTELDPAEAEALGREALAIAESAVYWLEDSEFEELAHDELHKYGRYVRTHFPGGCHLDWTGHGYEMSCPVSKAHKRMGFSIGFVGDRLCSVCGDDVSECEHVLGQFYDVTGGLNSAGYCPVCHGKDCSEHTEAETFRVRTSAMITNATLNEVSLVAKPKQPDARMLAHPVDLERLKEHLGPDFVPGMRVDCSQCLFPCAGVEHLDVDGIL